MYKKNCDCHLHIEKFNFNISCNRIEFFKTNKNWIYILSDGVLITMLDLRIICFRFLFEQNGVKFYDLKLKNKEYENE
jgi:hypothetical protein